MLFDVGSEIRIREVLHERVWLELPATVVADDEDVLAVRIDPGAPLSFPPHPFGAHPWSEQSAWLGPTVLRLYRPGLHYSVWRLVREGEPAEGWYVNFERPIVRGRGYVDIDDWGLDILIAEDRSWEWKDVEDPERMVATGRLTPSEIGELRVAAVELAIALDRDRSRWWESWSEWRP